MPKHTHSWRRFSNTTFLCHEPTCFKRIDISFLDGKLAVCPACRGQFIISKARVQETDTLLTCPKCGGQGNPELNIEEIHRRWNRVAKETYTKVHREKLTELLKKEESLNMREKELTELQSKIKASLALLSKKQKILSFRRANVLEIIKKHKQSREVKLPKQEVQETIMDAIRKEMEKV